MLCGIAHHWLCCGVVGTVDGGAGDWRAGVVSIGTSQHLLAQPPRPPDRIAQMAARIRPLVSAALGTRPPIRRIATGRPCRSAVNQRIFARRRFDPRLLIVRLARNRQRLMRILDVDHARHERAAGRQLQLVLRQLDRNRITQRQTRRRIESGRSARPSERFPTSDVRNVGDLQPVHGADLQADEQRRSTATSEKPPSAASAIRAPCGARIRTGWKYPDNGPPR